MGFGGVGYHWIETYSSRYNSLRWEIQKLQLCEHLLWITDKDHGNVRQYG
jgi:hypothetical protein